MAQRKRSRPAKGGRPRPPAYTSSPIRPLGRSRRRGLFSRSGQRRWVVVLAVLSLGAFAGIAIASAVSSGNDTATLATADTNKPAVTPTPTHALGPFAPSHSASPRPTAHRTSAPASHRAAPVHASSSPKAASPSPAPKPTPTKSAKACPTFVDDRVSQARELLAHPSALGSSRVVAAGPRAGTLGTADYTSRTVTLYVRSCADEPTLQLAVVWMYETGQFVSVEKWDEATRAQWRQLRGAPGLVSTDQLRQDVAAVFAYWQTGTTKWWQSPVAPPSASRLSSLVPYLKIG